MSKFIPINASDFNKIANHHGLDIIWDDSDENGIVDVWELSGDSAENDDFSIISYISTILESQASRSSLLKSNKKIKEIDAGYLIYNTQRTLDEYLEKLNYDDGVTPMILDTPSEELKEYIGLRVVEGLKLNEDSLDDYLLVLSYRTYASTSPKLGDLYFTFLLKVLGNEEISSMDSFDSKLIESGVFLDAFKQAGGTDPIRTMHIDDNDGDGLDDIRIGIRDYEKGQSIERLYLSTSQALLDQENYLKRITREDIENQRGVVDAVLSLKSNLDASHSILSLHEVANRNRAGDFKNIYRNNTLTLNYQLLPAYVYLGKVLNAIESSPELEDHYNSISPDFLAKLRSLRATINKTTLFDKKDLMAAGMAYFACSQLLDEKMKSFRWKGKSFTRFSFTDHLSTIDAAEERKNFFIAYTGGLLAAHLTEHGLLGGVVNMVNTLMQKYGFADATEVGERISNGLLPDLFLKTVEEYHAKYDTEIGAYINELREGNEGHPVYEWDVPFLEKKLIKDRFSNKGMPKIAFDDALKVAKRFFKDIGADLDSPELSDKIFLDVKNRPEKTDAVFANYLRDGEQVVVSLNHGDDGHITMHSFGIMLHEMFHALQYVLGSKHANGMPEMGAPGTSTVMLEGLANQIQFIISDKKWMDRYLSDIKGFESEDMRASLGQLLSRSYIYTTLRMLITARWEIELYRNMAEGKNAESIMHLWPELTERYLRVERSESPNGGTVYAIPHFCRDPFYYMSYEGGRPTADRALSPLKRGIAEDSDDKIAEGGAMLLGLLSKGGRLVTIEDYEAVIATWR